jgi:DNA-binding phage protein
MKIDKFHAHEALDRTHMVLCILDDFVCYHPVVKRNKKMKKLAHKASLSLSKLYQLIGSENVVSNNDR